MANALLMSVRNIATTFGVSRFGLYRKIRAGEIPAYHFGRKVLLDPAELREALRRPQKIALPSSVTTEEEGA
jgi:excisionase family DNA binding protein